MQRTNSLSSLSSTSSDFEETIPIFVKSISGEIIPLSIPPTTSISTLKSLLAIRTNLPISNLRLVYAGKHLPATINRPCLGSSSNLEDGEQVEVEEATLSSLSVARESTILLAYPLRGGMAKKPTCDFRKDTPGEKCTAQAQRIVGDCGFCGGHFCSKHRLLESHQCSNLEDCKKESHARNADKLIAERTVAIKGV